jgi:uncharacterized protein YndB with AHSA1/START domain
MQTRETECHQEKAATASPKLEITRIIRASRDRVYRAWTQPEILPQWFGSAAMTVPGATLDVREGGQYEIQLFGTPGVCSGVPDTPESRCAMSIRGEYCRVVPNELLQFTWCGTWEPAEISLVTVALKDVEGGTELTLTHEQFATEVSRDRHQQGWGSTLARMAQVIEN